MQQMLEGHCEGADIYLCGGAQLLGGRSARQRGLARWRGAGARHAGQRVGARCDQAAACPTAVHCCLRKLCSLKRSAASLTPRDCMCQWLLLCWCSEAGWLRLTAAAQGCSASGSRSGLPLHGRHPPAAEAARLQGGGELPQRGRCLAACRACGGRAACRPRLGAHTAAHGCPEAPRQIC